MEFVDADTLKKSFDFVLDTLKDLQAEENEDTLGQYKTALYESFRLLWTELEKLV